MAIIQAVLANSSPNLLTHSDLFTTFAPTLAKDAPFGVGSPSPEASPFGGAFVIIAPLKYYFTKLQNF
jgi:hypothetical protein